MNTVEFVVAKIPPDKAEFREILIPPEAIDLALEDVRFVGPVGGRVQLLRQMQNVYVKGRFSVQAEMGCRRCLKPLEICIEAEIECQFCPADELKSANLFQEDTGERLYSENKIDLSEEIRQALTLEIPPWSICPDEVGGICSHCGIGIELTYTSQEKPSPFAVLANLFDPSDQPVEDDSNSLTRALTYPKRR